MTTESDHPSNSAADIDPVLRISERDLWRHRHARRARAALSWWRERPPEHLNDADIASIRAALLQFAWPGERQWHLAQRGDAAAAIRLALLDAIQAAERTDLVMSCLLVAAATGSDAARLVLTWSKTRSGRPAG